MHGRCSCASSSPANAQASISAASLELVAHLVRRLRGVARQVRPFVAVHPGKARALLDER